MTLNVTILMYGCYYVEVVSLILLLRYHPTVLYKFDIPTCTFILENYYYVCA